MSYPKPAEDGSVLIAVYGTLLDSPIGEFKGPCEIPGELYDAGGLPAIKRGVGTVRGQMYRVTKEKLDALDIYEGHPSLYQRRAVTVRDDERARHLAWVYFYNRSLKTAQQVSGAPASWKSRHLT